LSRKLCFALLLLDILWWSGQYAFISVDLLCWCLLLWDLVFWNNIPLLLNLAVSVIRSLRVNSIHDHTILEVKSLLGLSDGETNLGAISIDDGFGCAKEWSP